MLFVPILQLLDELVLLCFVLEDLFDFSQELFLLKTRKLDSKDPSARLGAIVDTGGDGRIYQTFFLLLLCLGQRALALLHLVLFLFNV